MSALSLAWSGATAELTSMLLRVALEYWANLVRRLKQLGRLVLFDAGQGNYEATSMPKPPANRGPMPTVAVTLTSTGTFNFS